MEEILTIYIDVLDVFEVKGKSAEAAMINFTGNCKGKYFNGNVLPGGVDTQKEFYPQNRTLSARYMLDGLDDAGKACKIFIENEAVLDSDKKVEYTIPKIITDSKSLSWMEDSYLKGKIEPKGEGIIIHIFKVD
ncbi:DUF3237 family protein [Butyrivibrio sp. X503]|uniref:DUF3237 family protein n=1 Tax=Butyrivibrio sp. X503 TaxID=2364878 RepID=UPI000EAA380F|nr:DUF3237 family protein [Butyrivibrio sp. X503]RKM57406.1 DUF3237 family protein [Butyrivibrio sp. X503]